jgi:hypothetical protein
MGDKHLWASSLFWGSDTGKPHCGVGNTERGDGGKGHVIELIPLWVSAIQSCTVLLGSCATDSTWKPGGGNNDHWLQPFTGRQGPHGESFSPIPTFTQAPVPMGFSYKSLNSAILKGGTGPESRKHSRAVMRWTRWFPTVAAVMSQDAKRQDKGVCNVPDV